PREPIRVETSDRSSAPPLHGAELPPPFEKMYEILHLDGCVRSAIGRCDPPTDQRPGGKDPPARTKCPGRSQRLRGQQGTRGQLVRFDLRILSIEPPRRPSPYPRISMCRR